MYESIRKIDKKVMFFPHLPADIAINGLPLQILFVVITICCCYLFVIIVKSGNLIFIGRDI